MGLSAFKLLIAVILFVVTINLYFLSVILIQEKETVRPSSSLGVKKESKILTDLKKNEKEKLINADKNDVENSLKVNTTLIATQKILSTIKSIKFIYKSILHYKSVRTQFKNVLNDFTKVHTKGVPPSHLWNTANQWVGSREVLPLRGIQLLSDILHTMSTGKIIHAENSSKGTQLKILFTLEGGQKALFKPQWYSRNEVVTGPVFAGKDRHNGEVAAFYLSVILNMRRAPITVGRKIHLKKELLPVADSSLSETFYQSENKTCFYGVCYYCRPNDSVCCDDDGFLEGAVILWLPEHLTLKKYRHPWQRSYQSGVQSRWELDSEYCKKVRRISTYSHGPRLLDLIDTSIFDFLIDNGDRHHYEVFKSYNHSTIILLDNGKSFGNPDIDHIDILAPLYQCCRVRQSTWSQLWSLRGGELSNQLSQLMHKSLISPVLTAPHLAAIDRRLDVVLAAIHVCIKERNGQEHVFVID